MTDTGSMEPIPEAAVWAERADAWSQRPATPAETPGSWEEPTSRWSDVAATGRPAFPPDGVGWRSETAEWRSSTETARWRTTTEWRSSEGTSGWRSTTEAWQTGGNRDGRGPAETPTRQPAISGTAWPTPAGDERPWTATPGQQPSAPAWQAEPAAPAWQSEPAAPAGRSEPAPPPRSSQSAPPWQTGRPAAAGQHTADESTPDQSGMGQSGMGRPAAEPWQTGAAAPPWQAADAPAWQQPVEPTPPWQSAAPAPMMPPPVTPPWQSPAPMPTWQQPEAPAWQQDARQPEAPAWQQPEAPSRHQDARQPEARPRQPADRPTWRQPVDPTRLPPGEPSRSWQQAAEPAPTWRQPADPTPAWQQPAASSPTWQQRAEPTPSWQQRAASSPTWQQPAEPTPPRRQQVPAWQEPAQSPAWRTEPETRPGQQVESRPTWQSAAAAPAPERPWDTPERSWTRQPAAADPYPGAWSGAGHDDGRHLVREDDRAAWRRDEGTRRAGRRRAAEPEDAGGAGTGWAVQSDADNWAGHADTGAMPLYQEPVTRDDGWRRGAQAESRRARRAREEPDSGSWARDDEPRTDSGSWRGRAAPEAPSWRGADSPEDTAGWRRSRELEAASDPWERGAADTGIGDLVRPSQPRGRRPRPIPRSDIGGRTEPDDRHDRWTAQPDDDPREPRGAASVDREGPGPTDTPTEVRRPPADPGGWQREQAARGTARYREGHTEDWRRELAAQTRAPGREPQRFGTSDFPPFRAPGAAGATSPGPSGASRGLPVTDPREHGHREELLVGSRGGGATGSWQRPPDTQWPPRGAAGYQRSTGGGVAGPYERRPVSTLPDPSSRRSLLDEPDDDFEEVTGGPLAAVGYTALWYGVPVVLFVLYMLVLDSKQQAHALGTLTSAAPQFGLSLALSMAVAVGLRWASGSWKAASVGLAAAVMGGGVATVLMSAITGQSLT